MIPVFALGNVLANRPVWQVAFNAHRRGMMAALAPGVVLIPHDVAVRARLGICRQIRQPFGILEGVSTNTGHDTQHNRENHRRSDQPHVPILLEP